MSYCKVHVSKFISLILSVCFLFVLTGPTFVLLTHEGEELSVFLTIEKEAENKSFEETNDLSELDFDLNTFFKIPFFEELSSFLHWPYKDVVKINDLKITSPPPDLV